MGKKGKSRRARGSGTIFYDARRQVWIGRIPYGRDQKGNTRYRTVTRATQGACVTALRQIAPPEADTTVSSWAERWYHGLTCRSSTRADYRATLDNYVLPTIGHIRVTALTVAQIEAALIQWRKRLSPNTLVKNVGHLRACLESARRAGLISVNPARSLARLKPAKVQTTTFTPSELAMLAGERRAGPMALMAAVGCRIGEALALDVGDYDRAAGTVAITKTYSRQHGIRPPKTGNGYRTIRVPEIARPVLDAAIGRRTRGPLFPAPDGTRMGLATARQRFKALCRRLGIVYRRPHVLRHSAATVLVSAGVPLGDVARFLGDSVGTVVRVYLHAAGTDPATAMESAFAGKRG